jgi:hypothetical protein
LIKNSKFKFSYKRFEIKCLSKRYPIKVNNFIYTCKDKPIPIGNKTFIAIGEFAILILRIRKFLLFLAKIT